MKHFICISCNGYHCLLPFSENNQMDANFESAVTKALPSMSKEKFRRSGYTSTGQKFVIVVTKGLWYKIRLFLEEDYLDKRSLTAYHSSEHMSMAAVNKKVILLVCLWETFMVFSWGPGDTFKKTYKTLLFKK